MTPNPFPTRQSAIHRAALLIIASGPRPTAQLFTEIDFGANCTKLPKLRDAFENGWLIETPAGIDVTESTRAHFADQQPKQKHIGQVAPPAYRGDWRTSTLSKKHIPDRRGPRADVPAWSVRPDGYAIKTTGGA